LEAITATLENSFLRQFDGTKFVTGVLCRLDLSTGALDWVNGGHPPPLLMRTGRIIGELEAEPRPPFGLGLEEVAKVSSTQIEPGDRLVFYSDGVIEARSPDGVDFEFERLCEVLESEWLEAEHDSKIVQGLIGEVKTHASGPLRDDATLAIISYRG
jgi:serine phosphatase RsbU (regulator of sigma subunit)